MFDTMESVAHFVLKPFYRCLAEKRRPKVDSGEFTGIRYSVPLGCKRLEGVIRGRLQEILLPAIDFQAAA